MSKLMKATHRLDKAVGKYLGEKLFLVPTIEGEFESGVDETRQGGEFFGHLMLGKESADLGGGGKAWDTRVSVSGAVLKVGDQELPDGSTVQQNDVIIAKERDDQAFKVALITRKLGLLVIELDDLG